MGITGVVFLIAFAAGCFLALARHPIYGLMTYVGVFYLHPPARWWGQAMPDLRWSLTSSCIVLLAILIHKPQPKTIPLFSHQLMTGFVVFVCWLAVQSIWALDSSLHLELLGLFAKYALLIALIYVCIDSERHLKYFMWTQVAGALYLGWLAYSEYKGGRFEGFGAPNINEANAGALQVVTGLLVASALFLAARWREKAVLFGGMPFIVNALITTISRSGFIATGVGGLVFNMFSPVKYRKLVRVLSILGIVLFFMLTNPLYWLRMNTLQVAGENIQGVDTGGGRLEIIKGQWNMFKEYPLGCGHRCTAILSPRFIDDRFLDGVGANRARASHNTPMTMLVEHGVPGFLLYVLMVLWTFKSLATLWRRQKTEQGFVSALIPAVASVSAAIIIGDLFVDYLKMEVRIWFFATLMVMLEMTAKPVTERETTEVVDAPVRRVGASWRARPAVAGPSSTVAQVVSNPSKERV